MKHFWFALFFFTPTFYGKQFLIETEGDSPARGQDYHGDIGLTSKNCRLDKDCKKNQRCNLDTQKCFTGSKKEGESCGHYYDYENQCEPNLTCQVAYKVCVKANKTVGEFCIRDYECNKDLKCNVWTNLCVKGVKKQGQRCFGGEDESLCEGGLDCDSLRAWKDGTFQRTPVCIKQGDVGDPCEDPVDCNVHTTCDMKSRICVKEKLKEGSPCQFDVEHYKDEFQPSRECEPGLHCGKVVPGKAVCRKAGRFDEGENCFYDNHCKGNLRCHREDDEKDFNGTCAPPGIKKLGEECSLPLWESLHATVSFEARVAWDDLELKEAYHKSEKPVISKECEPGLFCHKISEKKGQCRKVPQKINCNMYEGGIKKYCNDWKRKKSIPINCDDFEGDFKKHCHEWMKKPLF